MGSEKGSKFLQIPANICAMFCKLLPLWLKYPNFNYVGKIRYLPNRNLLRV
jgi:hypothetical protein